jgi:hypothetical protein
MNLTLKLIRSRQKQFRNVQWQVYCIRICRQNNVVGLQGYRSRTSEDTLPNQRYFDSIYFLVFLSHPVLILYMNISVEKLVLP